MNTLIDFNHFNTPEFIFLIVALFPLLLVSIWLFFRFIVLFVSVLKQLGLVLNSYLVKLNLYLEGHNSQHNDNINSLEYVYIYAVKIIALIFAYAVLYRYAKTHGYIACYCFNDISPLKILFCNLKLLEYGLRQSIIQLSSQPQETVTLLAAFLLAFNNEKIGNFLKNKA